MTIKTSVIWERSLEAAEISIRDAELAKMVASGDTDGILTYAPNSLIREWSTKEAAEAWIAFVNTFTPPPVSAIIVE